MSRNNPHKLSGSRAYLSGPIDISEEKDHQWRPVLTRFLNDMGVLVFDPWSSEESLVFDKRTKLQRFKESGDWDAVRRLMKPLIRLDLRALDVSDFIVVGWPPNARTTGTIHEIVLATDCSKPTLICCTGGLIHIPNWFFGIIPRLEYLFDDWNNLMAYIRAVDEGQINNTQWQFTAKQFK